MSGIKLLLVDDDEEFVGTLAERLGLRDMTSNAPFDGEEAMKLIDRNVPDIFILDLRVPGVDGMELLRRVRRKYPRMQVIIQTGHGNDLDESEARRLRVFDYLKKPVDLEFLIERIRVAYEAQCAGSTMSAAAFAEAGEHETAVELAGRWGI